MFSWKQMVIHFRYEVYRLRFDFGVEDDNDNINNLKHFSYYLLTPI